MSPGGVFVVEGVVSEAAVEDADEAVADLAQGGVVADLAAAEIVVVGGFAASPNSASTGRRDITPMPGWLRWTSAPGAAALPAAAACGVAGCGGAGKGGRLMWRNGAYKGAQCLSVT